MIYDDIRFDDDSCFEMSDEHKKEFHDLIIDFVKKNATHPNYWSIFEIKENEYKITGEW